MRFQPAILALLLAAGLGVVALALATPGAWAIVRHWDPSRGTPRQIRLEQRTTLLSTLVDLILVGQMAALLLFVFNADRMADLFVGAMCAVGALRVNEWGFPALYAQLALFFLASQWLILDHADQQSRAQPLVRLKFALLIGLLPVMVASAGLQWAYFSGLRADVITSCCGSLFSTEASSIGGDLAALPPETAMAVQAAALLFVLGAGVWHLGAGRRRHPGATQQHPPIPGQISGLCVGLGSAAAFAVSMASVVSFLSLYVYEHPHHHCPFCLLKPEYGYRGYLLYVPLFLAAAAGLGVGLLSLLQRRPGLIDVIPPLSRRLTVWALTGFAVYGALAAWIVWRSGLKLLE